MNRLVCSFHFAKCDFNFDSYLFSKIEPDLSNNFDFNFCSSTLDQTSSTTSIPILPLQHRTRLIKHSLTNCTFFSFRSDLYHARVSPASAILDQVQTCNPASTTCNRLIEVSKLRKDLPTRQSYLRPMLHTPHLESCQS